MFYLGDLGGLKPGSSLLGHSEHGCEEVREEPGYGSCFAKKTREQEHHKFTVN